MGQIYENDSIDENLSFFQPLSNALSYTRLPYTWVPINSDEPIFQKTFNNLVHFICSPKQILRPGHLQSEQRSVLDAHILNKPRNKGAKNAAGMSLILDLICLFQLLVIEGVLGHLIKIIDVSDNNKFMILTLHLQIVTGEDALFGHLKSVTDVSRLAENDTIKHIRKLDRSFIHDRVVFSDTNDVFGTCFMKHTTNFLGVT